MRCAVRAACVGDPNHLSQGAHATVAEELDKYEEDIDKLIDTGKEKGYLTYGEVNDLLPGDITTPDDLDDLLTTINTQGIDVLSGEERRGRGDRGEEREVEAGEESDDVELDLSPGTLEKTNDPVRMYLREMGTVPLLTREGEVEIAKRIERGQLRVMKAISRSPIVIREIVGLGEDLRRGVRNIKEVVTFDEEELTEEILQSRVRSTVSRVDSIVKHQKKVATLEEKLTAAHEQGSKGKDQRSPQDPLAHRPRARPHQPHRPRAQVHQRREEAAARQGQQDRRLHAHARAPDQVARRQVRGLPLRRAEEGVPPPAEELPRRPRARRSRTPASRSKISSAPSAR